MSKTRRIWRVLSLANTLMGRRAPRCKELEFFDFLHPRQLPKLYIAIKYPDFKKQIKFRTFLERVGVKKYDAQKVTLDFL